MIVIGLTGSIGMGKSTAAKFFAELGVPVLDADAVVHELYEGAAVAAIEAAFPGTTADGKVDRAKLGQRVIGDGAAIKRLEALVHPLYRAAERRFLAQAEASGASVAVLDVPLLFETGGDKRVDAIVVVSAPEDMQRARLETRPGMTQDKLAALLARQVPDAQKRARADFVVDTSGDFDSTRAQVRAILDRAASLPRRRAE
ncbi:MAG TPA: dephospho-CoA kinase [Xanthobacteraceae bacterium]|nr:dephospho-CoA kinase [Xanthobacteraceae bacterium]